MGSSLPQIAVRRLTQDALERLGWLRPLPAPAIPVSAHGWSASLSDLSFHYVIDELAGLTEQLRAAFSKGDARQLRASSTALAECTARTTDDLWCLAALRPARGDTVGALRTEVVDLARKSLTAIIAGCAADMPDVRHGLEKRYRELLNASTDTDEDPYEAAFGVPRRGPQGAWSVPIETQILTMHSNRRHELHKIIEALLSLFPVQPSHHFDALRAAIMLVGTKRPLIAVKAAVGVHQMIEQGMMVDPDGTAVPLRDLKLRVDKSAANHKSINWTIRMIGLAETDAERATLALDLYRKMVEGQLRPWAATLLRMRGRQLYRTPELAAIRELLLADGSPLLALAAAPILRVARNAAAHEDYVWDDAHQHISIGDDAVTVEELDAATEHAYAFMCGAESGWACARAASPELGRLLDSADPTAELRILGEHSAISHFGNVGLSVSAYRYERGEFCVELTELPATHILYCCHAVLVASRCLSDAERIKVMLAGNRVLAVMDVERSVLDVAWVVRLAAEDLSVGQTPSTFLPLLAGARRAVETLEATAEASAWLAINDIVIAYDEMRGLLQSEAGVGPHVLADHLVMVTSGLEGTMTFLPANVHPPLQRVLRLAGQMTKTLQSDDPDSMRTDRLDALASTARALHARWPTPAFLPTLEGTPTETDTDRQGSRRA